MAGSAQPGFVQYQFRMQFDPSTIFRFDIAPRMDWGTAFVWHSDPRSSAVNNARVYFPPALGWWTVTVEIVHPATVAEPFITADLVLTSDPLPPVTQVFCMGWKTDSQYVNPKTVLFMVYFDGWHSSFSSSSSNSDGNWMDVLNEVVFTPSMGRWMPGAGSVGRRLLPMMTRRWVPQAGQNAWEPTTIDIRRTAIMVVDPWNGGNGIFSAALNAFLERARETGLLVILAPGNLADKYMGTEGTFGAYAAQYVFYPGFDEDLQPNVNLGLARAQSVAECRGQQVSSPGCAAILAPWPGVGDPDFEAFVNGSNSGQSTSGNITVGGLNATVNGTANGNETTDGASRWMRPEDVARGVMKVSQFGRPSCPYENDPEHMQRSISDVFTWHRINKCIRIDNDDVVIEHTRPFQALLQFYNIDNVIIAGGALQQCIVGRNTGLVALHMIGKRIILARDYIVDIDDSYESKDDIMRSLEKLYNVETVDIRGIGMPF
eukprot:ANDGO_08336.mRNA.1 hypothetical protein